MTATIHHFPARKPHRHAVPAPPAVPLSGLALDLLTLGVPLADICSLGLIPPGPAVTCAMIAEASRPA